MGIYLKDAYGTEQEIGFIHGLGRWSEPGARMSRFAVLLLFRDALEKRKRWNGVSRSAVMAALESEIILESRHATH